MDNKSGLDKLRLATGWAVLGSWTGSIILTAVHPAYQPPWTLHVVMMLVAGSLFGPTIARRGNGNMNGGNNGSR